MSAPSCARGCIYRGAHLRGCAQHPDATPETRLLTAIFGPSRECTGCKPVPAAEGTLLCTRDLERMRSNLERTPDLCAHLRSVVDPLKATAYDEEKTGSGGSKFEAPAPMNLGAVDAASDAISTLAGWTKYFGEDPSPSLLDGLPSTVDAVVAYWEAYWMSAFLLQGLTVFAKDPIIVNAWDGFCGYPPREMPDAWSIQKALDRFPMFDRTTWATAPCPNAKCRLRTVRVTPPSREGESTRYFCTACAWSPSPRETFWDEYFGLVTA